MTELLKKLLTMLKNSCKIGKFFKKITLYMKKALLWLVVLRAIIETNFRDIMAHRLSSLEKKKLRVTEKTIG